MKVLPKKKSLYITIDYKDFVWHYQNSFNKFEANSFVCENNCAPKESIVLLLEAMDSFFNALNNLFVNKKYKENITLYTLLKLLEKDDRPLASLEWKLSVYRKFLIDNSLTFKDHLIESFLKHIQKVHYRKPKYKKNYRLFYFITCEIKSFLFKIIRKIIYKSKRDYFTNPSYFNKTSKYFDIHIDSGYLFSIEKEHPFLFYLYQKYTEDYYDKKEFNFFIKENFKEFKFYEEDLCRLIKKLLYNN